MSSIAVVVVACAIAVLAVLFPLQGAEAAPSVPEWPECQVAWTYRDVDWSILAGHSFYWSRSRQATVVYGHYFQSNPARFQHPMGAWGNYSTGTGIGYWPEYGMFGWPMECQPYTPWPPEPCAHPNPFDCDMEFNNLKIPANHTYRGQTVVNGTLCDVWWFVATNYPFPEGNVLYTAVDLPARPPIRMDILHNGRHIWYQNFREQAPPEVWGDQNVFCTGVSDAAPQKPPRLNIYGDE